MGPKSQIGRRRGLGPGPPGGGFGVPGGLFGTGRICRGNFRSGEDCSQAAMDFADAARLLCPPAAVSALLPGSARRAREGAC